VGHRGALLGLPHCATVGPMTWIYFLWPASVASAFCVGRISGMYTQWKILRGSGKDFPWGF
jgi:hypothetical protein